ARRRLRRQVQRTAGLHGLVRDDARARLSGRVRDGGIPVMMRRAATAPAAGAWMRPIAFVMTAVVAVTTLAACVPENTARSESRELRLYEGPIPEPAPLTPNAMGELVMPEPPSDFNDEAAMEQFQKDAQA